jgi:hypothetical protein
LIKEGLAGRAGQKSENSPQTRVFSESTEHLRDKEGLDVAAPAVQRESPWKGGDPGRAVRRAEPWGQVLGTERGLEGARGSGKGWLRPRPDRVDELEHVVGEFTGTEPTQDNSAHPGIVSPWLAAASSYQTLPPLRGR